MADSTTAAAPKIPLQRQLGHAVRVAEDSAHSAEREVIRIALAGEEESSAFSEAVSLLKQWRGELVLCRRKLLDENIRVTRKGY
jgi:hypothetical protein